MQAQTVLDAYGSSSHPKKPRVRDKHLYRKAIKSERPFFARIILARDSALLFVLAGLLCAIDCCLSLSSCRHTKRLPVCGKPPRSISLCKEKERIQMDVKKKKVSTCCLLSLRSSKWRFLTSFQYAFSPFGA
mmetsp:Transcript_10810/g.25064  ORF Transcript_10810/g.25064 Transcript_10810/m.25064 type:complete len:132 (+) Transcript_10810:530-925(+)